MVRGDAGELSRSEITKQGLGSHVKEFELFPPTINPYDSAQRVKVGCVSRVTGLKPPFPPINTLSGILLELHSTSE